MIERRCSPIRRQRWCALCKRPITLSHKHEYIPVGKIGYYRLQHRVCSDPQAYPGHPIIERPLVGAT